MEFKALLVERTGDRAFARSVVSRSVDDLPEGPLLIRVHFSSLNYKDALSATGNPGVTREFPHTPGIDAAGEVVSCADGAFQPGDKVIVTGFDLGMETDGGFGQMIRVPSAWAVKLPAGLSLKESMMFGTAGLTAAMSVQELSEGGVTTDAGPVLVTGATGGVGSLAVAMLARLGYEVVAVTGKPDEAAYLTDLGAARVIGREEELTGHEKPMMKAVWAGAIDCVGGDMLAAAVKATRTGGVVTCCGLVGSPDLPLSVFPFILRGVRLVGIESVACPMARRERLWRLMATDWKPDGLSGMVEEVALEGLDGAIASILAGERRRRALVVL